MVPDLVRRRRADSRRDGSAPSTVAALAGAPSTAITAGQWIGFEAVDHRGAASVTTRAITIRSIVTRWPRTGPPAPRADDTSKSLGSTSSPILLAASIVDRDKPRAGIDAGSGVCAGR